MARHRWDSKAKAMIVLEGLKGKPVVDICRDYQVSQAHYYRWRDKFLANMHEAFEDRTSREAALSRQVNELKRVVGDLMLELKKSETDW